MKLVLALDAGTTSIRTVAFDPNGSPCDVDQGDLTQYYPQPGWVEHDPTEISGLAISTLRTVARRARERGDTIEAVGLTNQRETVIGFDRANGTIAHRAIVWQDRRTTALCDQLVERGVEPFLRARTGLVLDPYFSGTKMRWLLDRGVLDGASVPALCTVDSFLNWILTGGPDHGAYLTEPSNASRTMLCDLSTRKWSSELAETLGVPLAMLADIVPSAGHFGHIRHDDVPELAGVPISGVLGDQQAALFGQGCFAPGMIKSTYGTGSFVLAHAGPVVPSPVNGLVSTVAWDLGSCGPTAYALEGSAFVAGAAIQWLRDELGWISSSTEMGPLATSVPSTAGVSFVPAFTGLGSPFWQPDARGALVGLTKGSSRAHVARAVVHAIAFQVRAMTDTFAAHGITLSELRADGGAAAMDVLLAVQAATSRVTVRRSASLEATARGAATVAGLGVGVWGSLDELAALWRADTTFLGDGDPLDDEYAAWLRAVQRASPQSTEHRTR